MKYICRWYTGKSSTSRHELTIINKGHLLKAFSINHILNSRKCRKEPNNTFIYESEFDFADIRIQLDSKNIPYAFTKTE